MTHSDTQLAILEQIYTIYDHYVSSRNTVCEKFCSDCCTCNVTLTSLEAINIIRKNEAVGKQNIRDAINRRTFAQRFIPKITTNQLAYLCVSNEDPPEEFIDPAWGKCPLLTDGECIAYDTRPFACRCMVSTRRCAETGSAEIDDFTITVNHVIMQYIEHVDQGGYSGNLADMLNCLMTDAMQNPPSLLKNAPLKVLLVPPGHRKQIEPILSSLNAIKA